MSNQTSDNNKRIAKNTAVLYVKLILSVIIGLYTSRVILQALGASDYGLYTIVGGIVSMMNFLGITMMSVTYRYIVVEFGKGEEGDPRKVFNTSLVIHIALVLLLLIVGETFGVYYVTNVANIDTNKIQDALFVLHLSLLATSFVILSIPFNGLIVAREKFVFTSVVEIGRTLLKLCMVIALAYYCGNRLRMFAIIMALYNIILPISMYVYCFIKDRDIVRWQFNNKRSDYSGILGYAFWIMIGALASIGQNQGSNMIINLFFNTAVNAAFGIGFQINNYVMMFVQSLNQAVVPQIMKSQSGHNTERSLALVYGVAKIAFFIMLISAVPLILNMDFVLKAWLKNVPTYTEVFASLLLIAGLVRTMGAGFDSVIQASGKIRNNQIFYSCAYLSVLPIMFILFKLGAPVYISIVCLIVVAIVVLIFQANYLTKITDFDINNYVRKTTIPCLLVGGCTIPLIIFRYIWPDGLYGFLTFSLFSLCWILVDIFFLGLTKEEKGKVLFILSKIKKNKI